MKKISELSTLIERVRDSSVKFIVVTGGVCSSIGKGILIASLGVVLKGAGYSVSIVKWDPYLNVDPGTMSPLVHGEVFVTADGAETDLDLGHYERLVGLNLEKDSSVSSGQIYKEVLDGEREGKFLGKCIQLVPHAVDVAKKRLLEYALRHNVDFVLLEIGGTVGDIEGELFLEAIRQLKMDLGLQHMMHAHLSFVPFLKWANEVKTKPTQHSVIELKRAGLTPDCLFLRTDQEIDQQSIDKLSVMCEVKKDYIFQVLTYDPVYKIFLELENQHISEKIQQFFKLSHVHKSDISDWKQFVDQIIQSKENITIGLVAKYVGSNDPYISVFEAIKSAAYNAHRRVNVITIEAEKLYEEYAHQEDSQAWKDLKNVDGIVVPGGFDSRGVEGKILACKWAREEKIPYLGLCLGMQVMLIEAARSLLRLPTANSTEFDQHTKDPVICLMSEQKQITTKGANMRLGSYICAIADGTRAHKAYKIETVSERHRHRYEVNKEYKQRFEQIGIVFSGTHIAMDLVEISEIKDHPFMVGSQFHPEFQSSPIKVHPLFKDFIGAVMGRVAEKEQN
ncbi:MAG TPA: CTP synthase [Candidatus Babeliales bacterium]|jgi:CTP synthase|nr:CTP synthase [Candidatus Babeliales bacterium]